MYKTLKVAMYSIKNNKVLMGIMLLICGVILPAFTLISVRDFDYDSTNTAQTVIETYGLLFAYFAGVSIPLSLFSYLHKRREMDFYNSMPIKRCQYFWGFIMSGIAMFLLPYCLLLLIHFPLFRGANYTNCIIPTFSVFFSVFCSAVLAVVFSGSVMSSIITFALMNGLYISLIGFTVVLAGGNPECYFEALYKSIILTTPVAFEQIWFNESYSLMFLKLIIAFFELIIGSALFKFRKSETTMALAFPKSRYPFQYIVMLMIAMLADGIIWVAMGYYDNYLSFQAKEKLPIFVLFTLIIIFASFVFLNIILEKSSRAAFSKLRHFFIFVVIYGAIFFGISACVIPNMPEQIMSFSPEYAIIYVDKYTVKEVVENGYYSDGSDYMRPAEPSHIEAGKTYYVEVTTDKVYALTDKQKLKKLAQLAQQGESDTFVFSSDYYHSYSPGLEQINNSFCGFTVKFIEDKPPFEIKEGTSCGELEASYEESRSQITVRFGYTENKDNVTEFLQTKLTANLSDHSTYGYYVSLD